MTESNKAVLKTLGILGICYAAYIFYFSYIKTGHSTEVVYDPNVKPISGIKQ